MLKKANDCNQNRTQAIQPHKSLNGLKFLEQFIGAELLTQFNETYNKFTPIWDSAESAHDLFVVWRKAKDLVSAEVTRTNSNTKTATEEPMVILDNFEPVAGPSKPIDFNEPMAGPSTAYEPLAGPSTAYEPVAGPSTAYEHVTDGPSIVFGLMAEQIGAAEHTVNSEVDLSNESPERQLALAKEQSLAKILQKRMARTCQHH